MGARTPDEKMVVSPKPRGWASPEVVVVKAGDSLARPRERVTIVIK